jgi:hypothetical protein
MEALVLLSSSSLSRQRSCSPLTTYDGGAEHERKTEIQTNNNNAQLLEQVHGIGDQATPRHRLEQADERAVHTWQPVAPALEGHVGDLPDLAVCGGGLDQQVELLL